MLPEKWLVKINRDERHPVLTYLKNKYPYFHISSIWKYYGEDKNKVVWEDYINATYTLLTTEEFLEMTTGQEVYKKGDVLYSETYKVFRKVFSIIEDDIVFVSNTYLTLEAVNNTMDVEVVTKQYLENKNYKLYNSENPNVLELTLEEIAQRFNVDVKDLKIKK